MMKHEHRDQPCDHHYQADRAYLVLMRTGHISCLSSSIPQKTQQNAGHNFPIPVGSVVVKFYW